MQSLLSRRAVAPLPPCVTAGRPGRYGTNTAYEWDEDPSGARALPNGPWRRGYFLALVSPSSVDSAAMKASCGTSTAPTIFIRFLPSFCFSSSFRLREMSPP